VLHWPRLIVIISLGKLLRQGNSFILLILATAFACGSAATAWGAGFALIQQGTAAMAQGNAFVADASDASAIFYNPAGLSQLKRPQVYQGLFLNYPDREFSGGGQDSETNHRLYRSMSVYIAVPVHKRVAVGIGFFSPFGMGTVWPPTWAGRYITTFSRLQTYNLNPVISVKLLENLSVAAGFDVLWSKVKLKRKSYVSPTRPDAEVNLNGDGNGNGYNFGMLYEPIKGVKLGVAYRSQIKVTHYGDLTTSFPGVTPAKIAVAGSAAITYPASLTAGISYSRFAPFTFEFDTTWTGWSSYKKLKVNLEQPVGGTRNITTPKNWVDAWAFRFGANYQVNEAMKIRAGYIYDLTPVPDDAFDPQVPDANRHIFTVGGDLKIKRFTLGIAYNYILTEPRTKTSTINFNGVPAPLQANGRYNSDVHSLGLSWSFQF
jgi:long-chain fatty acid transport protein